MLVPDSTQKASLEQATLLYESQRSTATPYLEARGVGEEVAAKYRLGVVTEDCWTGHEKYRGRLAIPYITRGGVVTMRFRRLSDDGPKYLSLAGDMPRLYNVNVLHTPGDMLIITEGEFDAMVCTEYLGIPAIGVPGVSLWQPVFDRMVEDFDEVVVVGDGDQAGATFAETLADRIKARPVVLPDGEDVNSLWCSTGYPEALTYVM